jgi:hypothetical protein
VTFKEAFERIREVLRRLNQRGVLDRGCVLEHFIESATKRRTYLQQACWCLASSVQAARDNGGDFLVAPTIEQ